MRLFQDPMRLFDILFSLLIFILGAPIFLIIILAIRLDSPGPVFYKQLRVGKNGRFFMVWKFRSMTYTSKKGTLLTEANDSRITRTGHILRRLSLDELPNFINVLKGEMSLIGPRPEVPEITEHYTKFQKKVFRVRPGITGFSQIIFRQEITVDRKMRFDNWYIAHRSFCLYLWIVIMTPVVIFTNKGNR